MRFPGPWFEEGLGPKGRDRQSTKAFRSSPTREGSSVAHRHHVYPCKFFREQGSGTSAGKVTRGLRQGLSHDAKWIG